VGIPLDAFRGCENLKNITIPSSVTYIGLEAFYQCSNLTSLTLPEGLTSIGQEAFYACRSLTTIIIPKSLKNVAKVAFWWCDGLTDVYYLGSEAEWEEINFNNSNNELTRAPRYYYSEVQPAVEGNYWHYVDGVPTKW
jgi:hypothetical protein